MKKGIIGVCIVLLFASFSCELPYDGRKIIEFDHQFLDSQGLPVPDARVTYSLGAGYSGSEIPPDFEFRTDSQGRVRFSSFQPNNRFYVYAPETSAYLPLQSEVTDMDPMVKNRKRFYFFTTGEAVLFTVQFTGTGATKQIQKCFIEGIGNAEINGDDNSSFYAFQVRKSQTVTVRYTLFNSQTRVTQDLSAVYSIDTTPLAATINL